MWEYNYYNPNELYHYGVKGMKWGVRKNRTQSNNKNVAKRSSDETKEVNNKKKLTTKQKVAIGAAAAGTALAVIGGIYVYKKVNMPTHIKTFKFGEMVDVDSLPSKDTILSKGTKMQRISSKSVEDYATEGKRIYVSYLKKDNRMYKEAMPDFIRQWGKQGIISDDGRKSYEHVLKSKNDIKIPSKRAMAEMYMEATKSTKVDQGRYQKFMTGLVNHDDPEVKTFFEIVKKRGYNALIDENDAGNFTKSPLILLNPKNDIELSKSHRITAIEKIINVVLM